MLCKPESGHNGAMSKFAKHSYFKSSAILGCAVFFALGSGSASHAQSPATGAQIGQTLPVNASAKKADEFLATLKPPTSFKALLSGNDLLLEVPDIARAGSVKTKVVSTVARTDAMWLLSLHAMPDSGNAMFVSMQFDMSALPEATLNLQLYKTQPVLLVARAGGKYYGTFREVKVGLSGTAGMANPLRPSSVSK